MICSLAEKCICQGKLIELLQGVDWEEVVQTAGSAATAVPAGRGGHPETDQIELKQMTQRICVARDLDYKQLLCLNAL